MYLSASSLSYPREINCMTVLSSLHHHFSYSFWYNWPLKGLSCFKITWALRCFRLFRCFEFFFFKSHTTFFFYFLGYILIFRVFLTSLFIFSVFFSQKHQLEKPEPYHRKEMVFSQFLQDAQPCLFPELQLLCITLNNRFCSATIISMFPHVL